jgi:hypothetical protein
MRRNFAVAPRRDKEPAEKRILNCNHYWLIEKATGPKSRGECKYCGTRKDFSNFIPDLRWDTGVFSKPESGLPVLDEIHKEGVLMN